MNIYVLNTNFVWTYLIDNYQSLIWTDRYNKYGDFELKFQMDIKLLSELIPGYYLKCNESEHLMIIESIEINTDSGDVLTVKGRSLEAILERRVVWGQAVLSGDFQQAIRGMINAAIISPTVQARRIPNFIFDFSNDSRIDALTIDAQYNGDDLYSIISGLCENEKLGFKIILNDSNQLVFSLYFGTDKSYAQNINSFVVFSPSYDNLSNSNYLYDSTPERNVALVGGEGEGSERKFVTVGNATGLNRREMFVDASDISSTSESGEIPDAVYRYQLTARGREALSKSKASTAYDGEVEETNMYKYRTDYFVGDVVQFIDKYGNGSPARITEYIISHDASGFKMYPTFDTNLEDDY